MAMKGLIPLQKKATLTESWRPGMIDSITEGGVKQLWSDARRRAREISGYGKGKFARWDRHSLTNYTQLRTNKGNLQAWRYKIGKASLTYLQVLWAVRIC